jgi:hypothetical protein
MIVLYSEKHGIGKNTWTDWFGKKVIGESYFLSIAKIKTLFEKFNKSSETCILCVLEEGSGDIKMFMEQLKNKITDERIHEKNLSNLLFHLFSLYLVSRLCPFFKFCFRLKSFYCR